MRHPAIQAVSFTGSNDVGVALSTARRRRAASSASARWAARTRSWSSATPTLDLAVESTVQGAFGSTGQRCTATSRAVVVESIATEFLARLEARTASLVVGNGLHPATTWVRRSTSASSRRSLSYVETGKREGATLVRGGSGSTATGARAGSSSTPTIFDGVTAHMRIAQEEIFGPVLSIIRVPDAAAALTVANDVRFGLSASIYTNDVASMFRFVDRLDAGIIHVNSPTVGGEAHIPFGGMKATGVGLREMGRVAIDFYTELKVVYVDYTGGKRSGNLYQH